jgi:hypothetical protein
MSSENSARPSQSVTAVAQKRMTVTGYRIGEVHPARRPGPHGRCHMSGIPLHGIGQDELRQLGRTLDPDATVTQVASCARE